MNRLAGKRCVITGAGSGIGRASALRFAHEGAAVLVVGRSRDNTEETAALVRHAGGRALAMVADATVEREVESLVARCVAELGGLDVFFANAGTPGTNTPLPRPRRRKKLSGTSCSWCPLRPGFRLKLSRALRC